MNPIQNPLFKEPVGATFRIKREALGMSIDEAAKNMKFGTHLVQAIENEQWDALGPAIFAKSYVSSYIKLLGLDESIKNEIPNLSSGTTVLKAITQTRVEPAGIQSKSVLVIVTLLGLIALGAFFYNRNPTTEIQAIENSIPLSITPNETPVIPVVTKQTSGTSVSAVAPVAPVADNMPAPQAQQPIIDSHQIVLKTKQQTWLEIRNVDNAVIYSELLSANQELRQSFVKIGRVTLGNASSVELLINNTAQNIGPFIKSDGVARFTVDASGNAIALIP